jgi:hypothetical protein
MDLNKYYSGMDTSRQNASAGNEQFDQFDATELYCSKCKMALPIKKKLLLILPDGELYEYRCARCGNSVGRKTEKKIAVEQQIITI